MPSDWDPAQDADNKPPPPKPAIPEPAYLYGSGDTPWLLYALTAALLVSLCAACGWLVLVTS